MAWCTPPPQENDESEMGIFGNGWIVCVCWICNIAVRDWFNDTCECIRDHVTLISYGG